MSSKKMLHLIALMALVSSPILFCMEAIETKYDKKYNEIEQNLINDPNHYIDKDFFSFRPLALLVQ